MDFEIVGKKLIIFDGITEIGYKDIVDILTEAQIEEVFLPSTVTAIGDNAFFDFTGINSISIPEGVRHIGSQAFWGLDDLEELILPVTVEFVGRHAFCNCMKLKLTIVGNPQDIPGGWDAEFAANIKEICFLDAKY